MKKYLLITAISASLFVSSSLASASVTVTAASGGANVSADKPQNGAAPGYTTLGDIVITEGVNNDFAVQTSKTLILTAPAGWRFNAGVGAAVGGKISGSGGPEISVNSITVTASNLTANFSVNGTAQVNTLTISGIQVQANEGGVLPDSGTIFRTAANPGTATLTGIANNSTSFGSLSQAIGALRLFAVLPGQT